MCSTSACLSYTPWRGMHICVLLKNDRQMSWRGRSAPARGGLTTCVCAQLQKNGAAPADSAALVTDTGGHDNPCATLHLGSCAAHGSRVTAPGGTVTPAASRLANAPDLGAPPHPICLAGRCALAGWHKVLCAFLCRAGADAAPHRAPRRSEKTARAAVTGTTHAPAA